MNPFVANVLMVLLLVIPCTIQGKPVTIKLRDCGIEKATTGIERYDIIRACHEEAVRQGAYVSYEGIDSLYIEIPKTPKSIWLTEKTDFAGVKLVVCNKSKDMTLFVMMNREQKVQVSGYDIDKGNFKHIPELSKGYKILIVRDNNEWINKRLGYNDENGYKRSDVLLIKNGKAWNSTIMPYDNDYSTPKAYYCEVSPRKKEFKNLIFIRDERSTHRTDMIDVRRQYNVEISNVSLTTPEDDTSNNDGAIFISGCSNVTLKDITINGTYSQYNQSGYGVRVINVHDLKVIRMYARAKWGVFGNFALNKVALIDCDINRFDIHYYGRDIVVNGCKFVDLYNQFSSIYGVLRFKKCTFDHCVPVLIESSFNAFTPFELEMVDCIFNLSAAKNYVVTLCGVPGSDNERHELKQKCLPNILLKNCRVNLEDGINEWYLIKIGELSYKGSFGYIQKMEMKNIVVDRNSHFKIYSQNIQTTLPVREKIKIKTVSKIDN